MLTRIVFITLLPMAMMACSALQELGNPAGPENPEPEEVVSLPPEEARQELADLGIQYSQVSFIASAENGDLEAVRLFVWAGMDVNVQPYTASTVMVPMRENPTSISHLQYSWFPQEGQEDDDTALMKAAGAGHLDVVEFLMNNEADAKIKNQQNQHALMFAAAGGHLEIVKFIAENTWHVMKLDNINPIGYDPLIQGPITSIMWAAYGGHLDVVQYLYEGKDVRTYSGLTFRWLAFLWAVIGNHIDVMDYILETDNYLNGVNKTSHFDSATGQGLMLSSYHGHQDVVEHLLDLGANIFYRKNSWIELDTPEGRLYYKNIGFGPLHAAIQASQSEILCILLNHWMLSVGADGRDEYGMTALMFAAAGGDLEMSRRLIDNGAPVNGQSDIGITALMFASEWGHADVVRILLEEGADASLVEAHGNTALSLAEENGHAEIVEMLQ